MNGNETRMKTDCKAFIEHAFTKLHERGWLTKLTPSAITEADLASFEQEYQMTLPTIFKTYLTSYRLPQHPGIAGLVRDHAGNIKISIIDWHDLTEDISDLSEDLNCFRAEFEEWDTPPGLQTYGHLFPIGYMDGWYCLDLSQSDGEDCPVVWLEYGGFWEGYYDADGVLHGECVAPDFRTLLEWYFCGTLEAEYGKIHQTNVDYAFYRAWIEKTFRCAGTTWADT